MSRDNPFMVRSIHRGHVNPFIQLNISIGFNKELASSTFHVVVSQVLGNAKPSLMTTTINYIIVVFNQIGTCSGVIDVSVRNIIIETVFIRDEGKVICRVLS